MTTKVFRTAAVVCAALMSATALMAQHSLATRDFFYVGGAYSGEGSTEVMAGQMYVEVLRPSRVTKPYPLVFFHGAGQTATNWISTPDGRADLIRWCRVKSRRSNAAEAEMHSGREYRISREKVVTGIT